MSALSRQSGAASPAAEPADRQGAAPAHHTRIMPPQPTPAVGVTRQGLALFAVGDFCKAEQAFRIVVEVAPDQPLAWNNLALALVGLDRLAEAAAALERALALDPAQLSAWTSLAGVRLRLGRTEAADEACGNALALDPDCAEALQTRAFVRAEAEDFAGAADALSRALELSGESAALRLNLGALLMKCGRFEDAAINLARSLALDPACAVAAEFKQTCDLILAAIGGEVSGAAPASESDRTFKTALLLLNAADRREAAAVLAQAWAAAAPGNIEALHLRDAALRLEAKRQPAELVAQHFDGIAEDFDDRLVRRLAYQGPERLADLIGAQITADGTLDVLDLGCGTGLCAPLLRPFARRLAGIDLSEGMLAKARALGLYDSLDTADLLSVLGDPAARWDLMTATDTFPYLGDLEAVFEGAAAALRAKGWFAFSTEAVEGQGFVLKASGRYGHAPRYIERLAAGRFTIVDRATAPIRREAGHAVTGDFFLLRRL
ncbi:MAG: tetratricopeptide repeat protein [Caulobacterales bacterium]|jgi:predicted TPR repeat methyltransferase